jgi:hypothetical protein
MSEQDRELLELAAKAAGIVYGEHKCGLLVKDNDYPLCNRVWNPLEDDGDALRLAVKLRLEIDICHIGIAVRTPKGNKILVDSNEESCAYKATRRAIVRAAAEIGRNLK